jgi:hypothetical protein
LTPLRRWRSLVFCVGGCAALIACLFAAVVPSTGQSPPNGLADDYAKQVRPLLKTYCFSCHDAKAHKGDLDLERFSSLDAIRKDVRPWQHLIEQVDVGEMPPKGKPQPTAQERKVILAWVRTMLDAEARAQSGDPGRVPLRRLSNFEYDRTIRDLTGVDLRPTREFPADGAGGEGFTNAAESLADISPTLFTRYLDAAKDVADHAVLLPDGFRFSPSKTRRDWTDEATANLRKYYSQILSDRDGRIWPPIGAYLQRTVTHREALAQGRFEEAAARPFGLNPKYLRILWQALNDKTPSEPLDTIRAKWRTATEKDVADLAAEVAAWQAALWRTARVGNYVRASMEQALVQRPALEQSSLFVESLSRQVASDPPPTDSAPVRLAIKPTPGQSEVTIYLAARESGTAGPIVWGRPRFEAKGKPTLLLRDYADFGPAFEADLPSAFAVTAKYLSAVAELAHAVNALPDEVAGKHGLNPAFLKQWVNVLAVVPQKSTTEPSPVGAALTLLDVKTPPSHQNAISGWTKKGEVLPVVLANSSEKTLEIPASVPGRTVAVHPSAKEFVAVVWKSPVAGNVSVAARVAHVHPTCGNGVAWQFEHRRGARSTLLGEGTLDLGKETLVPTKPLTVEKGDLLVLAVDPRDANHFCDMTEVGLTITEVAAPKRVWDLGKDVANEIQAGNPHSDTHGNAETWSFARGPARPAAANIAKTPTSIVAGNSTLGRWRAAAGDSKRQAEAEQLAKDVEKVLTGSRPAEKDVDRTVYDKLVAWESPLFAGVDLTKIAKSRAKGDPYGLPKERFARPEGDSLIEPSDRVVEIRMPATLFVGREFVVDAKIDKAAGSRLARVRAAETPPDAKTRWDGPLLATADAPAYKQMLADHAEFRRVFPLFLCYPEVVPNDDIVTLKMFHREDEPLERLLLTPEQSQQLDRLWAEQRMISRQPVAEYDYLPQFIGFTTQELPKAYQQFFIDRTPTFKKLADEFLKEEEAAIPKQLDALFAFAEKANRRPLQEKEKTGLRTLYDAIRKKGAAHDEAFRGVLARVLASPSFLFRIEAASKGKEPTPVSDWELATRLSYFLWSSMPDDELRQLAAAGKLRDPKVLAEQAQRMLKDARTRSLAIEFGTQWIHVRGFDELKEKNEKLFPTFDAKLRQAIYEESILFFQDLFQSDRPIRSVLDSDSTFLNETLAKHYGIPGVTGPQWRKVDGVRKYGRGGILGLASVHAKQSGASRTSPVLRGNWVVETLLGEKLPRPPANVPILPDQEGTDKLTTRQMVEQHVSNASCATCHVRIDPFGFAFEKFDAIGRRREKESGGQPVDAKAKLRDGTEFEGVEGLRDYLLTKKKDVVERLFCQRLLGYALGRTTTLSDTSLIDEMVSELKKHDGRISAAVLTIVRSPQFRLIRGLDAASAD